MSFDVPAQPQQRIAIVGGGIAGLAAAWFLAPRHQVTVFEAAARLGGHARTVLAGRQMDQPVDTGFIVFNYVTYPLLTAMFDQLDVPVQPSCMSFGASIDSGRIEYGLKDMRAILGQRRNLARPGFLRMMSDILRFNAHAETAAQSESMTIGELIAQMRLGRWFEDYYLTPLCGAIWSTPPKGILSFPAQPLIRFFRNHALLSARDQHQWWTVKGGSIEYLRRLQAHLEHTGCQLRTTTPVRAVERTGDKVIIHAKGCEAETFDHIIMASHADDTLRLLSQPKAKERAALEKLRFQNNRMVLHCDTTQMPRRRACWSSWVYKADGPARQTSVGVTYWMNRLQAIPESDPLFVSLNPAQPIRDDLIYDETTFRHPVFDNAALQAQRQVAAIQGENRTWFAGSYLRNGFHEDGVASAAAIAQALEGVPT